MLGKNKRSGSRRSIQEAKRLRLSQQATQRVTLSHEERGDARLHYETALNESSTPQVNAVKPVERKIPPSADAVTPKYSPVGLGLMPFAVDISYNAREFLSDCRLKALAAQGCVPQSR